MRKELGNIYETKEQGQFGRNIEIRAFFLRHGAKYEESGGLTQEGKQAAGKFGEAFEPISTSDKYLLKAYTSEIGRSKDTADEIVRNVNTERKGHTRIKLELGNTEEDDIRLPNTTLNLPYSEYVKLNRQEIKGKAESLSFHGVAQRVADQIEHFIELSKRLKNDSKVDLLNVSHLPWISAFIKEAIGQEIEKESDPVRRQELENKIISLDYLDGFELIIKRNSDNVRLSLKIENNEFELTQEVIQKILEN